MTMRPDRSDVTRERQDVGESLVEILLTVMITGLTITALLASLATAGNAGNAQRNSVQGDLVMRNFAEAMKAGAASCVGGANFSVEYEEPPGFDVVVKYVGPPPLSVVTEPATGVCPNVETPQLVQLEVSGPQGLFETMQLKIRTP
jgi:hypothetical protein